MSDSPGTVPLPHTVKQRIKEALVALSLANLCFIKVSFDLLSDYDRYFDKLQVTPPMLWALAVNILAFTLFFWLVIQMLLRFQTAWLQLPVHMVFFLLLLYPVDFIRIKVNFFGVTDYQIYQFLVQPVMIVCEIAVLALLVWKHRTFARTAAVLVGILSPLGIFMLGKIALVSFGFIHLNQCPAPPAPPPILAVHAGQPRVIWIIFDETDYRLVFEQRPANVRLPEFDRLKAQSLFCTSAYSPDDSTIVSMPALITGRQVAGISVNNTCDLPITFTDTGETNYWSGLPSVFSEARALGFNTALVGWYIPYDRELGSALNFCKWYPYPPYEPTRAEEFWTEMRLQVSSMTETIHLRHLFVEIHRDSLQTSLCLVTNSAYGLTLLHLPAPHRPGIYLPTEDKFTVWGGMSKVTGYFNNLVLADRELGKLRAAMESSGDWDKTWVIMSADHSWRDSRYYDGVQRDFRVPFIIKPPGANGEMPYTKQFNTVLTHDLILAILRGEITSQQNLPPWLDGHGRPTPTVIGALGSN